MTQPGQRLIGHHVVAFTMDVYAHAIPADDEQAADALEAAMAAAL